MQLTVDEEYVGATLGEWRTQLDLNAVSVLGALRARRLVVVAPHPDDEVFGAGGLIQRALRERIPVTIVAVTDGESSHLGSDTARAKDMARVRANETRRAYRRLGLEDASIVNLHLPDGRVNEHGEHLADVLTSYVLVDDLCVAPWSHDGHPDHESSGLATAAACKLMGASMLSYLVWTLHWADPRGSDVPLNQCRRLELTTRGARPEALGERRLSVSAQGLGSRHERSNNRLPNSVASFSEFD